MIGYLSGTVREATSDTLILAVQGVGYEVRVPLGVAQAAQSGAAAELWIHTHVREDMLALYGFAARRERELFVALIGLSGVGPKLALAIMSMLTPEQLAGAVAGEDAVALTRVPGVGRKTAERLIIDLRGKLIALGITPVAGTPSAVKDEESARAVAALTSLGFDAARAVRAVAVAREESSGADTRALITAALRQLQRK